MKLSVHVRKRPRVEMIPLIDMIFLVLVSFTYAMLSMAVHRGVPVVLPFSSAAQIEQETILSVTVKADGALFVDKDPVALENLTESLKSRISGKTDPGALLFAENTLDYQELFSVLDRIRAAGIQRISLQAEAPRRP